MLTTRTRPARSVVEKQKADAGASFLSGVVALVDTFADGGEVNTTSTYQDLLKQMGAKIVVKLQKSVTHFIFQDGSSITFEKAAAQGCKIVSPSWVMKCLETLTKYPEESFVAEPPSATKRRKSMEPTAPQLVSADDPLFSSSQRATQDIHSSAVVQYDSGSRTTTAHSATIADSLDAQQPADTAAPAESQELVYSTPRGGDNDDNEQPLSQEFVMDTAPSAAQRVPSASSGGGDRTVLHLDASDSDDEPHTAKKKAAGARQSKRSAKSVAEKSSAGSVAKPVTTAPSRVRGSSKSAQPALSDAVPSTPVAAVRAAETDENEVPASAELVEHDVDISPRKKAVVTAVASGGRAKKQSSLPKPLSVDAQTAIPAATEQAVQLSSTAAKSTKRSKRVAAGAAAPAPVAPSAQSPGTGSTHAPSADQLPVLAAGGIVQDEREQTQVAGGRKSKATTAGRKRAATAADTAVAVPPPQPTLLDEPKKTVASEVKPVKKRVSFPSAGAVAADMPKPAETLLQLPVTGRKRKTAPKAIAEASTAAGDSVLDGRKEAEEPAVVAAKGRKRLQRDKETVDAGSAGDTPAITTAVTSKTAKPAVGKPKKETKPKATDAPIADASEGKRKRSETTKSEDTSSATPAAKKVQVPPLTTVKSVCTTALSPELQDIVRSTAEAFGSRLTDDASACSHLVVGDGKRTQKVLQALAHGAWLLCPEWALRSVEAEQWLPESDFVTNAFPGALRCRERGLLSGVRVCVLSSPMPLPAINDLIRAAAGEVVATAAAAHVVIATSAPKATAGSAVVVKPEWLFDSLVQYQLLDKKRYSL